MLEHTANIKVVAVENTEMRLLRIGENLERLGLEAEIVLADAGEPGEWARPGFDRILLDAPCSATGVIRRHPDIKVLRWQEDIAELHTQQHKLLNTMWDLLNPGGRIVYATCSILPSENEAVVAAFCESHPDAQVQPIVDVEWGIAQQYGRQVLPGVDAMDGFYYAVIQKKQ
jgi:16S rRNA (cytosine967-C5)-methyltransferase